MKTSKLRLTASVVYKCVKDFKMTIEALPYIILHNFKVKQNSSLVLFLFTISWGKLYKFQSLNNVGVLQNYLHGLGPRLVIVNSKGNSNNFITHKSCTPGSFLNDLEKEKSEKALATI